MGRVAAAGAQGLASGMGLWVGLTLFTDETVVSAAPWAAGAAVLLTGTAALLDWRRRGSFWDDVT